MTITVQDLDKNTERTITTNGAGLYDTGPLVPADRYMFLFKKEGFSTVQRGPMTLNAGVIGLNVQLAVGQSSQTVVVQDTAAPLLETSTAEISPDSASGNSRGPAADRRDSGLAVIPCVPAGHARQRRPTITTRVWEACR